MPSSTNQASSNAATALPLLDIALWGTDPDLFASQLRSACHEIGFFLLRHDLRPPDLTHRVLDETRAFFNHSAEEKATISYERSRSFRGYMECGVENTGGSVDVREQVELATEYAEPNLRPTRPTSLRATSASSTPPPPYYERLRSPSNPWPDAIQPSLRPVAEEYVESMLGVARRLREAMCVALGLERSALSALFGDDDDDGNGRGDINGRRGDKYRAPHWVLKLISYPPPAAAIEGAEQQQQAQQGVGPHTDTNFLTLLLQDGVHSGLQVFSCGEWIDVRPADAGPDVLVCNLGEQAEMLTGGYFLATPHRVIFRPRCRDCVGSGSGRQQQRRLPRTSVALFCNPMLSAVVSPLEGLIAVSRSTEYDDNNEKDHWRMEGNALLRTVGENTFKSLARSHPEVFRRHHPDLVLLPDGRIVGKDKAAGSGDRCD